MSLVLSVVDKLISSMSFRELPSYLTSIAAAYQHMGLYHVYNAKSTINVTALSLYNKIHTFANAA